MELFLEAVDVWLFRDGRPFDAGADHRAISMFPPYPSVVQGAIRSYHLVVRGVDWRSPQAIAEAVGTADNFGSLRMRGPFVARNEGDTVGRYFPLPADAVPDGESKLYRPLHPRPLGETPRVRVSAPPDLAALLWPPTGVDSGRDQPDQWLHEDELLKYLRGEPAAATAGHTLFAREHRTGVSLDSATRTAGEGLLYHVEFIRPQPGVGLWVEVNGYEGWPAEGLVSLGGEGRSARFRRLRTPLGWPAPPDPLPQRFKVYFATPAYFGGGWRPRGSWASFFTGAGTVTLQAVALRGYETVGGFDLAGNRPKPARRYVPAGSVYYFTVDGQMRLNPNLLNGAITELWPEVGFGQVIIGEW
jgi:CRISPR-associated protein Cmr3